MSSPRKNMPTKTQLEALRVLRDDTRGILYRCRGGYWTIFAHRETGDPPTWSVGTATVGAMKGRGWVEPLDGRRWAPVRITDAGRALVQVQHVKEGL